MICHEIELLGSGWKKPNKDWNQITKGQKGEIS